ncbi:MAG TPA: hypothetical protein VF216_09835 [Mizugakiibacter sp.]
MFKRASSSAGITHSARRDRSTDELIGICRGVLADGAINQDAALGEAVRGHQRGGWIMRIWSVALGLVAAVVASTAQAGDYKEIGRQGMTHMVVVPGANWRNEDV